MKKTLFKIFLVLFGLGLIGAFAGITVLYLWLSKDLPEVSSIEEYNPKKVSMVYDRSGKKIGEFYREKRRLATQEEIPDFLEQAFLAAEDSAFYSHSGVNFKAMLRAAIKNFMAGRTVQGGSTITQQVVKKLFLTDERSYKRKGKEVILARRLEKKFSKDQILNLYLNHIYLGEGAYGVAMASQIYFRKNVTDLEIGEAALLAGLTNRPSKNSPLKNPKAAKRRQKYVLYRMAEEGFITDEQAGVSLNESLKVFYREKFEDSAPYFVETVRQILVDEVGEDELLEGGLSITTSLDLDKHLAAKKSLRKGLRELDKRQGFRGAKRTLSTAEEVKEFLESTRNSLIKKYYKSIEIDPEGNVVGLIQEPLNLSVFEIGSQTDFKPSIPEYIQPDDIVDAIVTKVSDQDGLVFVRFGEHRGVIPFESMKWAREPNPDVSYKFAEIKKPSEALIKGDVIEVKILASEIIDPIVLKTQEAKHIESHALVELEQEPVSQGALIAFDQKTDEIVSMVGGYEFEKSKYNRTYQAIRQTGSSFKPIIYAAALNKGYTPSTEILDIPLVFEESKVNSQGRLETKRYKPSNYSRDFSGDVIFRDALVRSLNVPTMQIINKIGVPWAEAYARRLGAVHPLNSDITLALGSSSLTLYEMTKIYSQFGRLGKEIIPLLVRQVQDLEGNEIINNVSLDLKFDEKIKATKKAFREQILEQEIFGDKNHVFPSHPVGQLITPQTAYVMTNILSGVIYDRGGTAGKARALGRPAAGKTGTTNASYDAWFMGYTPQIVAGVWVGNDQEKSLGAGESGGRAALPIWLDFMLAAHEDLPKEDFNVPQGITFANIDVKTGRLASASTEKVVKQAFEIGDQPTSISSEEEIDEKDLFKDDLSG